MASCGGSASGGGPCGTDTWSNFAGPFFNTYCNRCHGWTQQALKEAPEVVLDTLRGGTMPLGDPTPSQDEIARIQTWIGCGQP